MIPEAFKQGGLIKGIALLAGFQIAVVLTALQGHWDSGSISIFQ